MNRGKDLYIFAQCMLLGLGNQSLERILGDNLEELQ